MFFIYLLRGGCKNSVNENVDRRGFFDSEFPFSPVDREAAFIKNSSFAPFGVRKVLCVACSRPNARLRRLRIEYGVFSLARIRHIRLFAVRNKTSIVRRKRRKDSFVFVRSFPRNIYIGGRALETHERRTGEIVY